MKSFSECLSRYYHEMGYNCAETVLNAANEAWDIGLDQRALRLMGGFGGGMGCKNVCGAVSGGIAAMSGLLVEQSGHQSPYLMQKVGMFVNIVKSHMGDEHCEFLQPRFGNPRQGCFPTIERIVALLEEVMSTPCDAPRYLPRRVRPLELINYLENPEYVLIDARDHRVLHDRRMEGAGEDKHLPGAVNLRDEWLDDNAAAYLASKGIFTEKNLVLHGSSQQEVARLAERLRALGYERLFFFDLAQWDGLTASIT